LEPEASIRRFSINARVQHVVVLICFTGLVVTGFPQKYSHANWAKGMVLMFGGVERMRYMHHLFGTTMAIHLVWHLLELVWIHFVRRRPMTMLPAWKDVRDFVDQVLFNLGLREHEPRMGRYTFAEKLEYLALVWGTVVMVATGLLLLFPIHFAGILPGQVIPAAKAAHAGEALLALLAILTWHFYFVHIRHWNPSIFSGRLPHSIYEEEHALELAARAESAESATRPVRVGWRRILVFGVLASLVVLTVTLLLDWMWTGQESRF